MPEHEDKGVQEVQHGTHERHCIHKPLRYGGIQESVDDRRDTVRNERRKRPERNAQQEQADITETRKVRLCPMDDTAHLLL